MRRPIGSSRRGTRENIVFVTQVGDIINDRSKIMSQWTVASNAMAQAGRRGALGRHHRQP